MRLRPSAMPATMPATAPVAKPRIDSSIVTHRWYQSGPSEVPSTIQVFRRPTMSDGFEKKNSSISFVRDRISQPPRKTTRIR